MTIESFKEGRKEGRKEGSRKEGRKGRKEMKGCSSMTIESFKEVRKEGRKERREEREGGDEGRTKEGDEGMFQQEHRIL